MCPGILLLVVDMVVVIARLLAADGAQFHACILPGGYNQVILEIQVHLRDQCEPRTKMRASEAAARDLADQFAKEAGFSTVIWDG
jgi:hypothetical protein